MAAPAIIRNMVDSYVAQSTPNRNYGTVNRMFVGTGFISYLYWGNPIPRNAKVVSAKLHFYSANSWAGSITATVQRVGGKWGSNRVTWNNDPGVLGVTASQTKTGAGVGTHWIIDITAIMQTVANGGIWYGLRLTASGAAKKALFSMQAAANRRPWVEIEWSDNPLPPQNLQPRDGRVVGSAKPLLNWDFVDYSGNRQQLNYQVQIGTSQAMTTIVHDSGTIVNSVSQYDMTSTPDAPVGPNFSLVAGTTYWWRVRTTDGAGLPSGWSAPEDFVYRAPATLTITAPTPTGDPQIGTTNDSSPVVGWTFTGGTQRMYQVQLYDWDDPTLLLWDTGRVTSTANSVTIPKGKITRSGVSYGLLVRVWDQYERVSIPGATAYVEKSMYFTYVYSASVAPVSAISVTMDQNSVAAIINVTRSTVPDSFTIVRDGVIVQSGLDPVDYQVPGQPTQFALKDYPPGRRNVTYQVISVINGVSSDTNPSVVSFIRRKLSWLTDKDDTLQVAFANPDHELENGELSSVMRALVGNPLLITQSLYGESGTWSGRLADGLVPGLSARTMRDRLKAIRRIYNGRARLYFSDEVMEVYIHHLKIKRLNYSDGSTQYDVSFEFFEVNE